MARITEQEVHAAAAALDAQGVKPTATKVREKLGSGSFSTILTYLETYAGTARSAEEVPEAPEELAELLPIIWAKAWDIASKMFEAERIKYDDKINVLEVEATVLKMIIEEQDKEIEKNQEGAYLDDETIQRLDKENEQLKEKNAYLKGVIDGKKEPNKKPAPKNPAKQTTLKQTIEAAQP